MSTRLFAFLAQRKRDEYGWLEGSGSWLLPSVFTSLLLALAEFVYLLIFVYLSYFLVVELSVIKQDNSLL